MKIKPIKTDADHEEALQEIERLWGSKAGSVDGERLDVLLTLVEAYEEKHYPIPPPDPIEAILHQMESRGLSKHDLEPFLGSPADVSRVLNKKQPLSLEMIRRLQSGLGISAQVLIQPYQLKRAS
jgi:HTH-type transcriptional regulator/antitoxin HigA